MNWKTRLKREVVRPAALGKGRAGKIHPAPMKVLFITSNRIGDAVLSTGLIAWMVDNVRDLRLTVACGPLAAPLFEAVPGIERVIPMPKGRYGAHWFRLWRQVWWRRWNLIVDLRGSLISQGLRATRRKVMLFHNESSHKVNQLAGFMKLRPVPAPRIYVAPAHEVAAARLIADGGAVLAVAPTANWIGKIWPAERFVETIGRLTAPGGILPGARIAVFGGPGEEALARPVLEALPPERVIDLVGTVDLLTASACLRRCALFIGNDSAPMHLASASGIPTIGLFGPSKETVYGPWGERGLAVRTDLSYNEIVTNREYDHRLPRSWMGSLPVDKVVAEAEDFWRDLQEA